MIYLRSKTILHGLSAITCIAAAAGAQDSVAAGGVLPEWSISGTNRAQVEVYQNRGNPLATPYADEGGYAFNEFNLDFRRRVSPYERIWGNLGAVANESAYRSPERGVILERGSINWEKGNTPVPFRVQAGDVFAYQSLRTIQLGLKGAQVEFQPYAAGAKRRHSIQVFAGGTGQSYRDVDEQINSFAGASWLIDDTAGSALSVNAVHRYAEAQPASALPAVHQTVLSLAGMRDFTAGAHELSLEGELARFYGDHENGFTSADTQDKSDSGIYVRLAGESRASPLRYQLTYERYGQHYRPGGAPITPNQRAVQARAGWSFDSGLQMRGRLQSFRDSFEGSNPLDTDVAGLELSGRLLPDTWPELSGSVNGFVQRRADEDGTVDTRSEVLEADLSAPVAKNWTGRFGVFGNRVTDDNADTVSIVRQVSAGADYDFVFGATARGSVSPGLALRRITGPGSTATEVNPTLQLSVASRHHQLQFSHNVLRQEPDIPGTVDLTTKQTSLIYSYNLKQHQLGLEADYFDRAPDGFDDTTAYRLAAFWTVQFDRPAPAITGRGTGLADQDGQAATGGTVSALHELAPGMLMDVVRERLQRSNISAPVERPDLLVYEVNWYPGIDRRQRLALLHRGGFLEQTTLVIDFDRTGGPETRVQTFERVREILLRRYGTPDERIEQGRFSATLAQDLASGRFARVMQWETPTGVLRFGIPRRADGQVRMEISHARDFPPIEFENWSLTPVR